MTLLHFDKLTCCYTFPNIYNHIQHGNLYFVLNIWRERSVIRRSLRKCVQRENRKIFVILLCNFKIKYHENLSVKVYPFMWKVKFNLKTSVTEKYKIRNTKFKVKDSRNLKTRKIYWKICLLRYSDIRWNYFNFTLTFTSNCCPTYFVSPRRNYLKTRRYIKADISYAKSNITNFNSRLTAHTSLQVHPTEFAVRSARTAAINVGACWLITLTFTVIDALITRCLRAPEGLPILRWIHHKPQGLSRRERVYGRTVYRSQVSATRRFFLPFRDRKYLLDSGKI